MGYLFRKFCLAENFVGELSGLEVGLPETPLYYMPTSSPVRKCRHRKVRNKILAKIENNSRSKHARETQFLPDCSLDIPASENHIFKVAAGEFNTVNDQQVGLLRTLLKSISNGIFVQRAVKETKTK